VNPGNLEVRIVIDHTFTDPVCDCCVGFLKFKVEEGKAQGRDSGAGG
jgi:hypothetical protein